MKDDISIAAAVFYRAAELVEQGWSRVDPLKYRGGVIERCAFFAVKDAARELEMNDYLKVIRQLQRKVGVHVSVWNANAQDSAEVAAYLRKCGDEQR